jgi:hypothetical protein
MFSVSSSGSPILCKSITIPRKAISPIRKVDYPLKSVLGVLPSVSTMWLHVALINLPIHFTCISQLSQCEKGNFTKLGTSSRKHIVLLLPSCSYSTVIRLDQFTDTFRNQVNPAACSCSPILCKSITCISKVPINNLYVMQ